MGRSGENPCIGRNPATDASDHGRAEMRLLHSIQCKQKLQTDDLLSFSISSWHLSATDGDVSDTAQLSYRTSSSHCELESSQEPGFPSEPGATRHHLPRKCAVPRKCDAFWLNVLQCMALPQQPCCQYITFLQMAAVRTWTQACMAKGLVSRQPNS